MDGNQESWRLSGEPGVVDGGQAAVHASCLWINTRIHEMFTWKFVTSVLLCCVSLRYEALKVISPGSDFI